MNLNNYESSKFNYFLQKLADTSLNISVHNDKLIIGKSSALPEGSLEDRIKSVVNYINSHPNELDSNQKKMVEKIQNKFSSAAKEQEQEIQKTLQPYLNKLETLLNSTPRQKIESTPLSSPSSTISLQIAAAPKNRQEFEANLQLMVDHFPHYQLHNDLSIFNSTFQSMPLDWNLDLMMDALQAEFKKYRIGELSPLKREILNLLKTPKPIQMGIIIETSPANSKNSSMLIDFAHLIAKGIPCLVNRHFFQAQADNFKEFPNLNFDSEVDIYLQKEGDLCVIIPKDKSLTDLGFNAEHLEISKGEHLTPSGYSLQIAQDIEALLINETEKQRFFRLIEFSGHGTYSENPEGLDLSQSGEIAGLSTADFQQSLSSLKDKNMVFMSLSSCFSGGTNSVDIHLPDQTVPCPIYIHSSFDTVTSTIDYNDEYDMTSILERAQKMIFRPRNQGLPFITQPRQLIEADKQKLSLITNISDPTNKFTNLGTLLLPSNKADIPKVAYTLANPEQILDVSRAYKKTESLGLLEDKNSNRKAYVFSDPIVPFSLKVDSNLPMILLSRGGTAHHVLKEVIAPQQNIEEIAKETFNSFISIAASKGEDEPAHKVFFIGLLKCKFEGKEANLQRVMIKNTPERREVLFQLKGEEDFHRIQFKLAEAPGYPWKIDKSEVIDLNEALKDVYQASVASTPLSKALLQSTAGRQSEENFIEALEEVFFPEKMPEVAKLCSALLKDKSQSLKTSFATEDVLDVLRVNLPPTREKLLSILKQAYNFAQTLNLSKAQTEIKFSSYTLLIHSVLHDNADRARTILKSNPQTINEETIQGDTALMIAMERGQFEMAKLLIEQGADLNHTNQLGSTPFILACQKAKPEFIEWILQTQGGFKGNEGGDALCFFLNNQFKNQNFKIARFLIDHQVGAEADPSLFPLLAFAVENSADIDLIEKLLHYPGMNINQVADSEGSALHIGVASENIEVVKLLIEGGADINQKDSDKVTPLHYCFSSKEKAVELAEILLEAGAVINNQNIDGQTPLDFALLAGNKPLIEFLIRRGASLQIEDKNKTNSLELASKVSLLEFILQIPGIDLNLKNTKLGKLFQQALTKGDVKLARLLISHGVNINQNFENSEPPLMYYLRNMPSGTNPKPVIQFFIENGGNLTQQDGQGNTIIHQAMEKQDVNIFKSLREVNVSYDKPLNNRGETPFMTGLLADPKDGFLHELLSQDPSLLNRDLATILKKSIDKWDLRYPDAVMILMEEINNAGLSRTDGTLIYQDLIAASHESDQVAIEVDKIKDKLKNGEKPGDFRGLPPLHAAFYLGFESHDKTREIIETLIERFPECIHEKYIKCPTELTKNLDILKTLIKGGAEIAPKPTFQTCDLELMKLLDEKEVDLTGETGLHFLRQMASREYAFADQREGIEFLLSKIKLSTHVALTFAIEDGFKDHILNLLINHPYMNLQESDNKLASPLCAAIVERNLPIIKKLISMKAIYRAKVDDDVDLSNPFLALAHCEDSDEIMEIAEYLMTTDLKAHVNVIAKGAENEGENPLTAAILFKNERLATFLINHGADVNLPDKAGNTPLHQQAIYSVENEDQQLPLTALLLSKGARWDIPNKEGLTAKDMALKLRLAKVLQLMQ
jgi:ankyrin repeat protein